MSKLKQDKFHSWWMWFRAYAAIKGFVLAIQDKAEDDLPDKECDVLNLNDTDDKKKHEIKQRNAIAMSSLALVVVE